MPQTTTSPAVTGGETLTPGAVSRSDNRRSRQPPCAAVAADLLDRLGGGSPIVHVASSERRAEEIARALKGMAPTLEVLLFPPWDCLPYDRASPSREIMGRRMTVLDALAGRASAERILVTSPDALVQRLAPADVVGDAFMTLKAGEKLDRGALAAFCDRTGYINDDRIDEPGEVALLGAVIDIFPPDASLPVRLRMAEGDVIEEIRPYDPLSQRTIDSVEALRLGPASELIFDAGAAEEAQHARAPGIEHRLPSWYGKLRTIFDLLPDADCSFDPKANGRLQDAHCHIIEAHDARRAIADAPPPPPRALYLDPQELDAGLKSWSKPARSDMSVHPILGLSAARSPGRALAQFVSEQIAAGHKVALGGLAHELKLMGRALKRSGDLKVRPVGAWSEFLDAPAGDVAALQIDVEAGFTDQARCVTLVCASDVFGGRVAAGRVGAAPQVLADQDLALGDVVLHEDHGLGVLADLAPIEIDGALRDTLQLEYRDKDRLMVPIEEIDRVWRYGADATAVTLDRLKGEAWNKRRAQASVQIDEAAEALVAQTKLKAARTCDPIIPPKAAYERFCARFAYPLTDDQVRATEDVLADLASGRPMDRLICADVGYGKTEVALRAAAAAALAGRQVMIAAPTTVLARQHFEVFRRRFDGLGVGVAQLSRLVSPAEAKSVRAGLASGEIAIVVGTHALGALEDGFDDLGLVIIDEEQKFGAALKDKLRSLTKDGHILTLTATPIPRTLQAAAVGLQDVSVIATPPARRRPVRTFIAPFDVASLRTALLREQRRGGQSFIVAPQIADLEPLKAQLDKHVPELALYMAHGDMPADEVDAQMVAFADGQGDVLLATNIIESGLDVPAANTMIIWRPDRFGLAQLHQLRGRVGRGRVQGVTYLLTDEDEPLTEAARSRLSTLEAFDRLGSGLSISARDLDLRGGGDLVGEDQAGHMKLIGSALYHRLMERALRQARGEPVEDDWTPQVRMGDAGYIPQDFCPDASIRLNLYARLARLRHPEQIDAFEDEVIDRLGDLPNQARRWLDQARIRGLARRAGVRSLSIGPKGMALDLFASDGPQALEAAQTVHRDARIKDGRLIINGAWDEDQRTAIIERTLEALGGE